jgi:cysteinyl-tRNA synthetase
VEALIAERAEAKKARDFAKADTLRDTIQAKGIILEDGPKGTIWRRA